MAFHDMARMTVTTAPGTGPIHLGTFVFGYQTFAASGVVDGEGLAYNLTDFDANNNVIAWEVGNPGVYSAAGLTLSRAPLYSSNGNAAINAGPLAQVWLTLLAETLGLQTYVFLNALTTYSLANGTTVGQRVGIKDNAGTARTVNPIIHGIFDGGETAFTGFNQNFDAYEFVWNGTQWSVF